MSDSDICLDMSQLRLNESRKRGGHIGPKRGGHVGTKRYGTGHNNVRYGYMFTRIDGDCKLIRCYHEQHIIQLIWSYYHQHLNYSQIANQLNKSNYLKRGRRWTAQSVRYILSTTLDIDDTYELLVDKLSTVHLTPQTPMEVDEESNTSVPLRPQSI